MVMLYFQLGPASLVALAVLILMMPAQVTICNMYTYRCTVPNVFIVIKTNCSRKPVITTVFTADTQCKNVVTNHKYKRDDNTFTMIMTSGTV